MDLSVVVLVKPIHITHNYKWSKLLCSTGMQDNESICGVKNIVVVKLLID
jgi:hypothetical protein